MGCGCKGGEGEEEGCGRGQAGGGERGGRRWGSGCRLKGGAFWSPDSRGCKGRAALPVRGEKGQGGGPRARGCLSINQSPCFFGACGRGLDGQWENRNCKGEAWSRGEAFGKAGGQAEALDTWRRRGGRGKEGISPSVRSHNIVQVVILFDFLGNIRAILNVKMY